MDLRLTMLGDISDTAIWFDSAVLHFRSRGSLKAGARGRRGPLDNAIAAAWIAPGRAGAKPELVQWEAQRNWRSKPRLQLSIEVFPAPGCARRNGAASRAGGNVRPGSEMEFSMPKVLRRFREPRDPEGSPSADRSFAEFFCPSGAGRGPRHMSGASRKAKPN